MFITEAERKGTYYFEFHYCKYENPVCDGKTDWIIVEHWAEDSLLMKADDFDDFLEKYYKSILNGALLPNGDTGFDYCGVNYYDADKTVEFLKKAEPLLEEKYSQLIPWLGEAVKRKIGFYILGL
ncbi:MAG: hypothetical protein IJD97_04230 [Clostridia bacterium]|nr:hypothetical protein [Clostridia bacterium]